MKFILLSLSIVFSVSLLSQSDEGNLFGKVVDEDGDVIIGATIQLKSDPSRGAFSDLDGNYKLVAPAGNQTFFCKFSDKVTDTFSIEIIANGNVEYDIELQDYYKKNKDFEEIKVTVGKFDTPLEDLTVSMEVLRPEMIENKNTRSIETALDQTPGLNILDGEPQIRGGSGFTFGVGSKVAVIVDDMPMLSGDAGRPEWGFIPVENISQIEVIKGASSVLSGSSALSGAIHIRTAYPKMKPLTKVNLYGGLYSAPRDVSQKWWSDTPLIYGANALHSRMIKNWDITVGLNLNYDHGYIGAPVPDEFVEDTISNFDNSQMSSKRARANFNIRHRSKKIRGLNYGVNGNFMVSESNLAFAWLNDSTGLYQAYPGAIFLQNQFIFNLDPFVNYILESGGKHALRGRVLRAENEITGGQSNESTVYYGDYQFQKTYEALNNLNFIGGLSSTFTDSYAELYAGSGSPNNQLLNISGYGQIEQKIKKLVNLSLGGRIEYFQLNDSVTDIKPIFRAGTSFKVHQETYVRMSYGQGYRFPTITERFIRTGIGNFGVFPNPELKPETSWNAEVGVKQGFKFKEFYGYFDAAAFWQEYENTIEYLFGFWDLSSPTGAGFKFLNTGKSRVLGIDLSLTGQAKLGDKAKLNMMIGYNYILPKTLNPDLIYAVDEHPINPREYSYNSTSLDSSRHILKYRFLHNVKADMEFVHKCGLAIGVSAKYFSKMENLDDVILEFEEFTEQIQTIQNIQYQDFYERNRKGNWIFDARISYKINEMHKIAVIGSNILNNTYSLRPLKIESPRQLMLQYTFKIDKN